MKRTLSLIAVLCLVFITIFSCETGNEPKSPSQPELWPKGEIVSLFANHVFLEGYKIKPDDFSIVYYDDERNYHRTPFLPSNGIVLEIGKDENTLRPVTLGTTKYEKTDKIFRARITDGNHPAETCKIECKTFADLAEAGRLTLSLPIINIYQNTPVSDYPILFHGGLKVDGALIAYTESFITEEGKVAPNVKITFGKKDDPSYSRNLSTGNDATEVLEEMKTTAKNAYDPENPRNDSLTYTCKVEYTLEGKTITSNEKYFYVSGKDKNY